MKTPEQLKEAVARLGLQEWDHHPCMFCGYMTKYVFKEDKAYYDAGCKCENSGDVTEVDWVSVAEYYNSMKGPKMQQQFRHFFKFEEF